MQTQPVDFVIYKPTTHYLASPCDTKFSYQPKKGWGPLQRLAFWFLGRIGAFATDMTQSVTYDRITINPQKFTEKILATNAALMNYYHERGERLLIGPAEYSQLMNESMVQLRHTLSFEAPYAYNNYNRDTNNFDLQVCGMKVTIVPWMSGMIVLPKDLH
jgi:hypothetical protein